MEEGVLGQRVPEGKVGEAGIGIEELRRVK